MHTALPGISGPTNMNGAWRFILPVGVMQIFFELARSFDHPATDTADIFVIVSVNSEAERRNVDSLCGSNGFYRSPAKGRATLKSCRRTACWEGRA